MMENAKIIYCDILKTIKKGDYHYALVKNHPNTTKNGCVLYHRVVLENHLGRLLTKEEVVHHKNGDKYDNRVDNLELMDAVTHTKHHASTLTIKTVVLKCPNCQKIFERRHGNTHLLKCYKKDTTSCSRHCAVKFNTTKKVDAKLANARIKENVVKIYMRSK